MPAVEPAAAAAVEDFDVDALVAGAFNLVIKQYLVRLLTLIERVPGG